MAEGTLHIRKNDIVKIMAGREKGKVGRVLKVDREKGRILIEKVNMVKRHVKPGKTNPQGGIIEKEAFSDGRGRVKIAVEAGDQRDQITAKGWAGGLLPRRRG